MKYIGKDTNGREQTTHLFAIHANELETLVKLVRHAYDATPPVFDNMMYRGRLREMSKILGKVFVEEVLGRTISPKGSRVHKSIKKNLS